MKNLIPFCLPISSHLGKMSKAQPVRHAAELGFIFCSLEEAGQAFWTLRGHLHVHRVTVLSPPSLESPWEGRRADVIDSVGHLPEGQGLAIPSLREEILTCYSLLNVSTEN